MSQSDDQGPPLWHPGEKYFQKMVGASEAMDRFGRRVIRDHLTEQHRNFFPLLPYVLLGAVDAQGTPWATILEGPRGFAHSPHPHQLDFDTLLPASDPAAQRLLEGSAVGLLGIDLMTRRRNRADGRINGVSASGFSVAIEHSYGNCPQYIQLRRIKQIVGDAQPTPAPVERMTHLDAAAQAMIRDADTFFVASYVDIDDDPAKRTVDVSHRGGNAGFVRVVDDCLTIPDFAGNLHFNTLGNLLLNPIVGLLFVDFATGDMLQLSGRTEIIVDDPEIKAFQGAERLWKVRVEQVIRRPAALRTRWQFEGFSPNSEMTGSWEQTAARLKADALRDAWRLLRVTRIVEESQSIRSFYFEPTDGAGLPPFEAGQHLPVRFALTGHDTHMIRTYSLSSAPSDSFFRISVKRDGAVSANLHDNVEVGDLVEARAPQGHFTVDPREDRPLVLLAAGVGITPLLSMLREVVYQGKRVRHTRPTWFVQSARSMAELAFKDEIVELATRGGDDIRALRLISQPESHAREGEGFELAGRIDVELLKALLPFNDFDFYLCGPSSFTQALYDGLRGLNVQDERIHAETFGPSTLIRDLSVLVPAVEQLPAATESVPVMFSTSGKEARWEPGSGTLLELAESRGLNPEFSCRGGSCGTCKTKLISGHVHYLNMPADPLPDNEVLICCSVPAQGPPGSAALVLDI